MKISKVQWAWYKQIVKSFFSFIQQIIWSANSMLVSCQPVCVHTKKVKLENTFRSWLVNVARKASAQRQVCIRQRRHWQQAPLLLTNTAVPLPFPSVASSSQLLQSMWPLRSHVSYLHLFNNREVLRFIVYRRGKCGLLPSISRANGRARALHCLFMLPLQESRLHQSQRINKEQHILLSRRKLRVCVFREFLPVLFPFFFPIQSLENISNTENSLKPREEAYLISWQHRPS